MADEISASLSIVPEMTLIALTESWFAAKDAAGAVHIVWSQSPKDAALAALPQRLAG